MIIAKREVLLEGEGEFKVTHTLDVLNELSLKYKVSIVFEEAIVHNIVVPISMTVSGFKLEKQLNQLLAPYGLNYKRIGTNQYVVIQQPFKSDKKGKVQAGGNQNAIQPLLNNPSPAYVGEVEKTTALSGDRLPDKTVRGVVTDEKGEVLPGVNITVKNTTKGTSTDGKGEYSISVPDTNNILVFSYVGMQNAEVTVGEKSSINIAMRESVNTLKEVVTLGYTSQKQRDMIGSVAKVTSEQIAFSANNNIAASLQGKASGVYVSRGEIRIRGINSISLSTQPLWIIDGMPGDGSNLNPNDIESITVLKDASATALYGSGGSNGIIVSNHGGRQLDAAQSAIKSLIPIVENYRGKIKIMMDSGVRSGPDVARTLAIGADFVFMGRPFMYGVGALGNEGGNHTVSMLKVQLQQVMEQLCCERVEDFPNFLV